MPLCSQYWPEVAHLHIGWREAALIKLGLRYFLISVRQPRLFLALSPPPGAGSAPRKVRNTVVPEQQNIIQFIPWIYHTFIPHVSLGIFMLFCRNVGKNIVGGYQWMSSSGVSGGCWDNPLSSWQKPRWEVDLFSYFRQMYAKTLLLFWCGIRIHLGDIQIHK